MRRTLTIGLRIIMAEYSDWEIHSSDPNAMQQARNALGFTQGDGFLNGVLYSILVYGTKYTQQGTKQVTNQYTGQLQTVPNMVALPGTYAIFRWFSPTPFPPPGMNIPNTITIIPIPADSPYVFAAG
jgi:hypothetical protein